MSRQSKAKLAQGYVLKAIPKTCSTCLHLRMDIVPVLGMHGQPSEYTRETNLRCGLGGFAVKKMATCNEYAERSAKHE